MVPTMALPCRTSFWCRSETKLCYHAEWDRDLGCDHTSPYRTDGLSRHTSTSTSTSTSTRSNQINSIKSNQINFKKLPSRLVVLLLCFSLVFVLCLYVSATSSGPAIRAREKTSRAPSAELRTPQACLRLPRHT